MPDSSSSASDSPSPGSWPWLRERLFPRGTNLIQWAAYIILIALLVMIALYPPQVSAVRHYTSLLALAVTLVLNILWNDIEMLFPRRETGSWALILVTSALTFYTIVVGRASMAIYIIFMIAAQANAMLPMIPALAYSALLAGGFMALMPLLGASEAEIRGTALGLIIGMTFAVTLSQVLYRYIAQSERMNRLLEELRQANAGLLAARQKEKELAIAEERVRVARDLHDGLGHHLTALSIQLQAAEKLVKTNPGLAAEAVSNARGEVQAALKEVRQSVAALREAPVDMRDLPEAIAALAADCGQRAGLRATFAQQGHPASLSPAAALTFFRAAQEGLTNVQKHAAGAQVVTVRLVYGEDYALISVEDDGQSAADCHPQGGGFGLAGLRERAHLLGGQMSCGPRPEGGFRVELRLPLDREAAP